MVRSAVLGAIMHPATRPARLITQHVGESRHSTLSTAYSQTLPVNSVVNVTSIYDKRVA